MLFEMTVVSIYPHVGVCVDKSSNFKYKSSVMHRSLAKQDKFNEVLILNRNSVTYLHPYLTFTIKILKTRNACIHPI